MLVKAQVKYIQSLGDKKHRDQDGVFVAEGPKLIHELLHARNVQLVSLFATESWITANRDQLNTLKGQQVVEIDKPWLERISFLTTPNQVLAVFKKPFFGEIKPNANITLVLDNIQDPGNMGTMVRTADWFGIKTIVCSEDCSDVFNPKVVQATMGSIARVQVVYTSLPDFFDSYRNISVYDTVLDGEDIREIKPVKEAIIIIGNESKGISKELLKRVEHKITIPGKGNAESLNAAVATGIVLSRLVKW